jgi:hypothetical protein
MVFDGRAVAGRRVTTGRIVHAPDDDEGHHAGLGVPGERWFSRGRAGGEERIGRDVRLAPLLDTGTPRIDAIVAVAVPACGAFPDSATRQGVSLPNQAVAVIRISGS